MKKKQIYNIMLGHYLSYINIKFTMDWVYELWSKI